MFLTRRSTNIQFIVLSPLLRVLNIIWIQYAPNEPEIRMIFFDFHDHINKFCDIVTFTKFDYKFRFRALWCLCELIIVKV